MSTGLRFTLEVDGLPPDAFAVVSFHLNQSLSSLFSLDLSLVSQQFLSLEFAQVLDKMAYLTIWQGDEVQRRVKGVVTWFELGENDKNQMLYSMKVHPPLWRAGLRQNFRIFQNEDIKSILGTMLQENGVTEWSPLFSEPHPSREFCVQYGETDYDFLCRMAAEEGIFFYEEHAYKSTDQSLVLCDTVRHLPESFEIPWNPNTRTEVSTLCISQFRYSAQIRPSSVVTKDYTFKRPGWAGRFEQEGQHQDYQRTQYEVYDYPGRFKGAHGQNFARWQMDGWRNNAETARGMSRSPEIWPGRRIVLTGHPQANLNREWQVVASELHGEQPQAVPGRQGAGTALENHFAVIPADRTWRPQPLLKPLVDGPQSAVVTGPAGEEIFCDEHGRVRVKFNWDRYNPSNQDSSCWIRVAQAWAGTGFGNLAITEKTDRIPAGVIRTDDERTHHYHYDSQHRLVFYTRIQHGEPLVESRYLYDPLGRRMAKRVWRRERDLTGWMSLSRKPEVTWYGWDGDRLTTVQTDTTRIQTVYEPGSFTPLIRVETENGEREKAQRRSLAETLQQEGSENGHGVVFPAELVRLLDRLEEEIRTDRVSSESRAWLAQCGLTVEQLARQVEPEYTPARKVHFYHCDHRGLPLALISEDGNTAWRGEYDEWGNQLNEENPHHLHQPYRLPGQQHDEESGLYYNRHRHYDPLQGRYITPDPIGLRGGWNMYQYPLNPIQVIDPMGLDAIENMTSGGLIYAVSGVPGLIAANSITNSAYQFGYDMDAIVGGAHNGAADAMRHCYLMCRMTKTFGSTIADVIGKNHEAAGDRQGQPAKERIMDLKNNTVGIACGDFSAKCSDACIEKYNTGQLFGLDGIKADNPIKAKQGSSDASNY
ncbi:type IV secretion protein Rhs [Escherichia coli]|uniref:type VI secretion system tip protein TssI/VgrG n=1 Tax=Escherichia coli TaxID=562 RepID=UPI0010CB4670|nr:type VI secretion system tip protein TssI/VgrG [Escherichia coli]GCL75281.1 type IV secretion protein Rhs [Escherichia coli]